MSKLIVSEFLTLDGVMEAPGGEPGHPHSGWVMDYVGDDWQQYKLDETLDAAALLLGRVTYEGFAGAWPERSGPFADKMNAMPKHVVSATLGELAWENSTLVQDDLGAAVGALKARLGGPILVAGSRTLVHALMGLGLVDEYRVMIFPVVLGSGARLFPDSPDKTKLTLTGTQVFDAGVVVHTYHPS